MVSVVRCIRCKFRFLTPALQNTVATRKYISCRSSLQHFGCEFPSQRKRFLSFMIFWADLLTVTLRSRSCSCLTSKTCIGTCCACNSSPRVSCNYLSRLGTSIASCMHAVRLMCSFHTPRALQKAGFSSQCFVPIYSQGCCAVAGCLLSV